MRKLFVFCFIFTIGYLVSATVADAQETFSGTVFRYGSGRYVGLRTSGFTLTLNRTTPDYVASLSRPPAGGSDFLRARPVPADYLIDSRYGA